ncbi:MAG: Dna2/Cas4 domain-containing protein [Caldisphaera sp.]
MSEKVYRNLSKELEIGNIKLDRIKFKDNLILEVKKSKTAIREGKYQLLYYLYVMKYNTGLTFKGKLVIPKDKYEENVELNPEKEAEIKEMLKEIYRIIKQSKPPEPSWKPYCKGCMFYELCWS